jgi:hypothetical protein
VAVQYSNGDGIVRVYTSKTAPSFLLLDTGNSWNKTMYFIESEGTAVNYKGGTVGFIPLTFKPEELIK